MFATTTAEQVLELGKRQRPEIDKTGANK